MSYLKFDLLDDDISPDEIQDIEEKFHEILEAVRNMNRGEIYSQDYWKNCFELLELQHLKKCHFTTGKFQ